MRQAVRNPQDLSRILDITLNHVFTRGEMIANEVDRENLLNLLAENGNLSREEAEQQLQRWEEQFNQVKQQTQQAREMAMQKAEEFRKQAEQKAQEVYQMAQARVEEMQKEVENRLNQAKEEAEKTAQAAKETFTKVATAVSVAMIIDTIAAGGYFGAPESLPDIDADAARADIQVVANLRITPVQYGLTE